MMDDVEPVVTLSDGRRVLFAVYQLVLELQASGHALAIDNRSNVVVSPEINPNAFYILNSNWSDVAAILEVVERENSGTVH
jgi:predicted Fe-Mo cluster-binding NifX family protein